MKADLLVASVDRVLVVFPLGTGSPSRDVFWRETGEENRRAETRGPVRGGHPNVNAHLLDRQVRSTPGLRARRSMIAKLTRQCCQSACHHTTIEHDH